MVLIFSGHHFAAQNVFRIEKPLAACVATEEQMLLVATEGHRIETHPLNNSNNGDQQKSNSSDQHAIHSFPTVDLVKMIVYSAIGRYVAAVEVKASRRNLLSTVRVYLNWQSSDAEDKPMRARIAGRVTPSSHSTAGQLDMIEVPLTRQACHVAACEGTGNLAASCFGSVVCLFAFRVKVHDISRQPFYDFDPLVKVNLSFPVKEVALCEDVLACVSRNELQVLGLGPRVASKRRRKSGVDGGGRRGTLAKRRDIADDDPRYVCWPLSKYRAEMQNNCRNADFTKDLELNLHSDSWPLDVYLPSLVQQMETCDELNREGRQVLGPVPSVLGRPVTVEWVGNANVDNQTSTLLYRRFATDAVNEADNVQCVHSMQLKPFYSDKGGDRDESKKTKRRNSLRGMSCVFSTGHECCLYEIDLEGSKVRQLRSLKFSTAARQVIADGALLHAVSLSVLETYAIGMSQFTAIDVPEVNAACKNDSTCLVGLCPFLNLKHAVFGGGHLVLFSSSETDIPCPSESSATWTAYDLLCPSSADLHRDMVEEAESFRDSNPEVYAQILREALCVVCLPADRSLQEQMEETCSKLGEFYLRSAEPEENLLAVEFLKRSGHRLESFVRKVLDNCVDVGTSRRLLRLLMTVFTEDLVQFSNDDGLTKDTADEVIAFFSLNDSSQLSRLILGSRFTGYSFDKALEGIKSRINLKLGSAEDCFAACFLCANHGASHQVPAFMSSISTETMVNMARKYPQVWFEKKNVASAILQMLQQLKPEAFISVLIELIEHKHLEPSFLIDLCKSDWDDLGLAPNKHILLESCLESYVTKTLTRQGLDSISTCPEVVMHLIDIYLSKVTTSGDVCRVPSALHVVKPACLFGPRKSWLNELPPFSGRDLQGKCRYEDIDDQEEPVDCPCVKCCDYLLRLQSLLCSVLATPEIKLRVNRASKPDANLTFKGSLSLFILTSNPTEAIEALVSRGEHSALKEYGKDTLIGPKMWKPMLSALFRLWMRAANEDNSGGVLPALHGVLSYLSEIVSVTELVELFPDGADLGPFACHVKRCLAKQQADSLKLEIMAKERDLQAFV